MKNTKIENLLKKLNTLPVSRSRTCLKSGLHNILQDSAEIGGSSSKAVKAAEAFLIKNNA